VLFEFVNPDQRDGAVGPRAGGARAFPGIAPAFTGFLAREKPVKVRESR
jgi:hypothetical protein